MQYTRQVQYLHSQLAPAVPIDSFINAIKPAALGLTDKSQFYAPVRFSVQICGGINAPAGAIRVDVPIHANERWLDDMKKRFAGMIGLKNSLQGSDISFRTVAGQDIATMDQQHLPRVGKLNVYVGEKKIRLPAMPAIPVEYSVCKEANIQAWLQQVSAELPELIAHELVAQKNLTQLDAAVRGDGPVLKLIQRHLVESSPAASGGGGGGWSEFLRTHHMNSPDRIGSSEAQATLVSVSKDMLSNLRRFIEAAAEPIGSYISHLDAKRIASDLSKRSEQDVDHYKPLLASAAPGSAGNGSIDGHELYRKIAEDALASPFVQQAIIATVYTRPIESGCRWLPGKEPGKDGKENPKSVQVVDEDEQDKQANSAQKKATQAKEAAEKAAAEETDARKKAALQEEADRLAAEERKTKQAAADAAEALEKKQQEEALRKEKEDQAAAQKQQKQVEQEKEEEEEEEETGNVNPQAPPDSRFNAAVSAFVKDIKGADDAKVNTLIATYIRKNFAAGAEGVVNLNNLRDVYEPTRVVFTTGVPSDTRKGFLRSIAPLIKADPLVQIEASIGAHHPWNAQIHHTLQPLADGAYPTYYNLLHTKQDMSKDAAFAGDVVETYKAYHMFSGLPISPPGFVVEPIAKRAAAASGGGRRTNKKKSGKWSDSSSDDDSKFHRMKSEMPPLIPLGDYAAGGLEPIECGSCGGNSSSDDESQDEKKMSMIRGNLPPLERIDCGMSSSDEDDETDKKKNVKSRIGSSIAPPLVPLNGMPKLVPLSAPAASAVAGIPPRPPLVRLSDVQAKIRSRLVPISDDMQDIESSDSMANEDIGDAYGLPSCSDVFGD
jgi:hypothetical protein